MKFKKKIAFILSLPLILSAGGHKVSFSFKSENVLYKVTGDANKSLDVFLKPAVTAELELVARMYNNRTDALLFSTSFNDSITSEGKTYTINYPLRYRINGDGLRFTFDVSRGSTTVSSSGVLYPCNQVLVNALQYKNEDYTSENRFIKIEKSVVKTGESFSFRNFNEYLSKDTDNSINFSSVHFNFLDNYEFIYQDAEYHIKDYNNVYPDLDHVDGEVVLKMNCANNNGELSFSLRDTLYVKGDTLEMSAIRFKGYTETNKLFIPVGKQTLLEENDSYILIKEAGYSAIDIKLPLSYYFNKKIIGQCYEADYCIEGGVRE